MPKYRGDHDPIDDPSMRDLEMGKDLADRVRQEVRDLYEFSDPQQWDEYGYPVSDPEQLLIKVEDIRQMLKPLPVLEQKQLAKEIPELVERVLRVYPVFVTNLVDRFGYAQSLGKDPPMSAADICEVIEKAKEASAHIHPQAMQEDLMKILREEQRLALFVKEPRYYVFEREADNVEAELSEATFPQVWWNPKRAIGDQGEADAALQEKEQGFREAVRRLARLLDEMQNPLVREVASGMLSRMEAYLKAFEERIKEPGAYQPTEAVGSVRTIEDAYQTLGFLASSHPTKQELTKRYIELARQNHPDIVGDEGTKRMAAINAAMDLLRKS